MIKKINKILIANRGEIALRVMKTCKEMGICSVAIYSEADASAPFVKYADQAFCVGPAPSNQSYLNQEKIIKIALNNEVDAIHPGYGFLSENADFADKVEKSGMTFLSVHLPLLFKQWEINYLPSKQFLNMIYLWFLV
jgi:propionyl-CoA carboxylase alpha chain